MQENKKTLKQKVVHEINEYLINVVFLSLFFGAFATARRLTLEQYDIYLNDTFIGIIKAVIIAKVIMMGAFLKLSRNFENKPLIIPILYKTIFFVIFVIIFDFIEAYIHAYIDLHQLSAALNEVMKHHFNKMWLGGLIMVSVSFLPFFALKELSRTMGPQVFRSMFYKKSNVSE